MDKRRKQGDTNECLRYAIAACLDLELEDVPHFIEQSGFWFKNIKRWAKGKNYNVEFIAYQEHRWYFTEAVTDTFPKDPFVSIVGVGSMTPHAVVRKEGKVVYDSARRRKRYQKKGSVIIKFTPFRT